MVLPDVRRFAAGRDYQLGCAGFLPAEHQATTLDTVNADQPIADLFPPKDFSAIEKGDDKSGLDFLDKLNRLHQKKRSGNTELEARIKAYEMAARLQLSAPEVTDLRGETQLTKKLYDIEHPDIGPFGRQCLLARRLVETRRSIRSDILWCREHDGGEDSTKLGQPRRSAARSWLLGCNPRHTGASALLKDLKSRGMLDDTLVICTSEFGRQPAAQGKQAKGRDHNGGAFTAWMAGGGVKGGVGYGASDELGFKAADKVVHSYELHATALHLLGLNHETLSWYHNGLEQRLTGFEGKGVIHELLA